MGIVVIRFHDTLGKISQVLKDITKMGLADSFGKECLIHRLGGKPGSRVVFGGWRAGLGAIHHDPHIIARIDNLSIVQWFYAVAVAALRDHSGRAVRKH
jgi:hypothetical protein